MFVAKEFGERDADVYIHVERRTKNEEDEARNPSAFVRATGSERNTGFDYGCRAPIVYAYSSLFSNGEAHVHKMLHLACCTALACVGNSAAISSSVVVVASTSRSGSTPSCRATESVLVQPSGR